MKAALFFILTILVYACNYKKNYNESTTINSDYLDQFKTELKNKWPKNRTINLVFHGHSVPAGYFKTPYVNTLDSYPFQVLKKLKDQYPFAVINVINTSMGSETSVSGEKRFEADVLIHKPDILFIDYALNDRVVGLADSKKAWVKMIEKAKQKGIRIILLTPSPDLEVNLLESDNELEKHANQITALAKEYSIGLADSYSRFKQIKADCDCLNDYMSQFNHPNAKGHLIITEEIMKYFSE